MLKIAATIGTALLCAGLLTVLPGMAPDVAAGTPKAQPVGTHGETASEQPAGKADRLDARVAGGGCSERAWPYYGQDCLVDFEARGRAEPRKVRLVTTDRIH
jgi:hypothetical protein